MAVVAMFNTGEHTFLHPLGSLSNRSFLYEGHPSEFIPAARVMMPDYHKEVKEHISGVIEDATVWFTDRKRLYESGERTGCMVEELLNIQV